MVCAFAAAGLLAIFRLTQRLLDASAAVTVTLLTAVYPIWFAQSSLAHADIFAAAFTLWAFALYLPASTSTAPRYLSVAALFSLAALSKETSILQPAALAALEVALLFRDRRDSLLRRRHLGWIARLVVSAAAAGGLVCLPSPRDGLHLRQPRVSPLQRNRELHRSAHPAGGALSLSASFLAAQYLDAHRLRARLPLSAAPRRRARLANRQRSLHDRRAGGRQLARLLGAGRSAADALLCCRSIR